MTREEFFHLATDGSCIDYPSVYKLTVFTYDSRTTCYHKDEEICLWSFPLSHMSNLYSSKETAEEALHSHIIGLTDDNDHVHSALIQRLCLDMPIMENVVAQWWLYDRDGNEIDHSICADNYFGEKTINGVYLGRKQNEIRFKSGEIVEVRTNDIAFLAIVNGLPPTIQEIWEFYQDRCKTFGEPAYGKYDSIHFRDSMSDCYFYLSGTGYDPDIPTYNVIRPTFTPTEDVVKELTERYLRWESNVGDAISGKITWEKLSKIIKG